MDGDASLVVMATVALVGEDVLGLGGLVAQVAEQLVHGRGEGVSIVGLLRHASASRSQPSQTLSSLRS